MTTAYRSLYCYAWDIADIGVPAFVDHARQLGITDVTLATSYHAGKFIRPHSRRGPTVIFPEDGVVYFNPDAAGYGTIKPQAHSDAATRAVLADLIADGGLRVHAWTVLLHNSRIGAAHPDCCARNAFGDPYLYSLCPMQAAVQDYAINLCRDLSAQHALHSLVLETPGWLPYAHGYHHEFAQIGAAPWSDIALGLCFCPACERRAGHLQIDVATVRLRIQQHLRQYLNGAAPEQAIESDFRQHPDFLGYVAMRQHTVTDLVGRIRTAMHQVRRHTVQLAVIPSVQRPSSLAWTEGSDLRALLQSGAADYLEIPFYEKSAQQVLDDADYCLNQVDSPRQVRAILRPAFPDLQNGLQLAQALAGLQQRHLHDFAFYNYGLIPTAQLNHLGTTLSKLAFVPDRSQTDHPTQPGVSS